MNQVSTSAQITQPCFFDNWDRLSRLAKKQNKEINDCLNKSGKARLKIG